MSAPASGHHRTAEQVPGWLGGATRPDLAATADQIRYCLASNVEGGYVMPTHVNSIRRWVVAKLHGVTKQTADEVIADFRRVLSDGPGPTLETLGDVSHVGQGMYLPTPPFVVPLVPQVWIYVSGFPDDSVPAIVPFLRHSSVGRLLIDADKMVLELAGLCEVTVERYAGVPRLEDDPRDYLIGLVSDSGDATGGGLSPGSSPYSGDVGAKAGFNFGTVPRRGTAGGVSFELWRSEMTGGLFTYQLKESGSGREAVVDVDSRDWCRVALAIDALSGHRRSTVLSRGSPTDRLDLDHELPLGEYRLLMALGASWESRPTGRSQLVIPSEVRPAAIETLHRCWVDVRS